ncbi:MAG: ATP-dependent DNA ligase [Deltaproteobacteria bacterium]|nr:MAG: ATP-dependent DNA ligase [Deltaproteobacteria bacterium]
MTSQEVTVQGKRLKLSNLDKVLYPKAGFTKAQVIDYYLRIAPLLLPHLRDRPLTMKRYPDGVEGEFFFEKQCPSHRPDWVKTAAVWSDQSQREVRYCLVQDVATLAWAANLADLELHVPLHRKSERPDAVVFDLDPGAPAGLVQCCEVALLLKGMFDHLGLQSFAKTSGSKGLQIYLPLNSRATYGETKPFALAVARTLAAQRPDLIVSNMKKSLRPGKVLVDWSQNDPHKTTICVYSLRARERPTVSTPVTWDEVRRCSRKKDAALLSFDAQEVLRRTGELGDLFEPLLSLKQKLPRGQ